MDTKPQLSSPHVEIRPRASEVGHLNLLTVSLTLPTLGELAFPF